MFWATSGLRPRSPDYASIAHEGHYARLMELIRDARAQGGRIESLCAASAIEHPKIAPVAVFETHDSMRVMQEEIFGPILPVVPYERVEDAIAYINARPRPLALYVFDRDRRRVERTLHATASGGAGASGTDRRASRRFRNCVPCSARVGSASWGGSIRRTRDVLRASSNA